MTDKQILDHRDAEYCKNIRRNALITAGNMQDEIKRYFKNEKLHSEEAIIWVNPANTGIQDGLTKATGYRTLWSGISKMDSGDTLIIANGDWTEHDDMNINSYHYPPSGTSGEYTKIVAETEWEVRIPSISVSVPRSYIEIRGIVFDARRTPVMHVVYEWDHTKFIRCGFNPGKIAGNTHACGFGSADKTLSSNHHNLMEECVIWGGGRYMLYSKYGQYNIFRRCIVRHDYNAFADGTTVGNQISNFRNYGGNYHVYQNCISIDSDRVQHYAPLHQETAGFWIGDSYDGVGGDLVDGCISIKDAVMSYYCAAALEAGKQHPTTIRNSVALDVTYAKADTLSAFFMKLNSHLIGENLVGWKGLDTGFDGAYAKKAGNFTLRDSIIKDVANIGAALVTLVNVNLHNTGGAVNCTKDNVFYTDPFESGLLYPVQVESGSSLASQRIGATILKKIGRSGTLYGEDGWAEVTDEDLWPFPNEDKIKELLSETVEGVSGEYGFVAYRSPFGSPNTLTSYIWEYFGNKMPDGIYAQTTSTKEMILEAVALLDKAKALLDKVSQGVAEPDV